MLATIAACLASICLVGYAQTNSSSADAKLAAGRSAFIAKYHPLRVIDGELFDFTELVIQVQKLGVEVAAKNFPKWIVSGEVLQILDSGMLISIADSDRIVMLKNEPQQESRVDGSSLTKFAAITGRYKYTNTQGAGKTVIQYDCGRRFNQKTDSFKTKKVIRVGGTVNEVTVTDWDLK